MNGAMSVLLLANIFKFFLRVSENLLFLNHSAHSMESTMFGFMFIICMSMSSFSFHFLGVGDLSLNILLQL